jgi:uncharacterized protein
MGKEIIMLRHNLKGLSGRIAQERARKYLEISVKKGHKASIFYLGMMHELGLGGVENKPRAVELYEQAKEALDPQAMFKLALLSKESGNTEKYYSLVKQAAEFGLLEAQHNLACFYLEQNDEVKAFAWFLSAARYDFYPSVVNVGTLFLQGKGRILSNPLAAYIWLRRAQQQEDSEVLSTLLNAASLAVNKLKRP